MNYRFRELRGNHRETVVRRGVDSRSGDCLSTHAASTSPSARFELSRMASPRPLIGCTVRRPSKTLNSAGEHDVQIGIVINGCDTNTRRNPNAGAAMLVSPGVKDVALQTVHHQHAPVFASVQATRGRPSMTAMPGPNRLRPGSLGVR
jgi:hypothetical protein